MTKEGRSALADFRAIGHNFCTGSRPQIFSAHLQLIQYATTSTNQSSCTDMKLFEWSAPRTLEPTPSGADLAFSLGRFFIPDDASKYIKAIAALVLSTRSEKNKGKKRAMAAFCRNSVPQRSRLRIVVLSLAF